MYWKDIADLITVTLTLDSMRRPKKTLTRKEVYINKKSVNYYEFYQAAAQGFKPEILFQLRTEDYNDEQYIEYDGRRYRIIRHRAAGDITDLTCISEVVNNGE